MHCLLQNLFKTKSKFNRNSINIITSVFTHDFFNKTVILLQGKEDCKPTLTMTYWKILFYSKYFFAMEVIIISLWESWFYNTVDFDLVKSTKTPMNREITVFSFVFELRMHYLLNFKFVFFFKFVSRLFALCFIYTDIIH